MAQDLGDEERVAVGLLEHGSGQGRGPAADAFADELGDGAGVQWPQVDALVEPLLAGEVREQAAERVFGFVAPVATGTDDQQPHRSRIARDVAQGEQRRAVGPVQILEHEHDRPLLGGSAQQRADRLEEPVARALGIPRQGLGERGHALGQLRHDAAKLAADELGLARQHVRRAGSDVLAQGLDERLVGQQPLRVAATEQDDRAIAVRVARELRREPALADAGLAAQRDHMPRARRGLRVGVLEPAGGVAATDERRGLRLLQGGGQGKFLQWRIRPRRVACDRHDSELGGGRERGVLAQDRLVQRAQLRGGLDAQIVDQRGARRAVDVERLGLAAAAIEGEHELTREALVRGPGGEQGLELADDRRVLPGGE